MFPLKVFHAKGGVYLFFQKQTAELLHCVLQRKWLESHQVFAELRVHFNLGLNTMLAIF
jgi:hypothetical protein